MDRMPDRWSTHRCVVASIAAADVAPAQALYEKSVHMTEWDGRTIEPDYVLRFLNGQADLPPGGTPDRLVLQTVRRAEAASSAPIGILELYHGYPTERSLYIGFFFLDPVVRGQGFGREIVERCRSIAASIGYDDLRVGVALKNWAALRFWLHSGFRRAVKVSGDREHGEGAFAMIELSTNGDAE